MTLGHVLISPIRACHPPPKYADDKQFSIRIGAKLKNPNIHHKLARISKTINFPGK